MLAGDLQTYTEAGDISMAEAQVEAVTSEVIPEELVGIEAAEFVVEGGAAEAVPVEAFGAGATAGVVVGGVAAVAAVGGAAVVVKKKRAQKKQLTDKEPAYTTQPEFRPKGAGANVFEFDATNHVSITGRSGPTPQSV